MVKLTIKRYNPDTNKSEIKGEYTSLELAKVAYWKLQEIYPSVELSMIGENDYGDRMQIHVGYWKRKTK